MKKNCLLLLILAWFPARGLTQTADDWISQGRSDLAAHDLAGANDAFAQALTLGSTNETANALYAVTRLLSWPSQPSGSNFLTHLGFPIDGRNIYHWTAVPPANADGFPLIPAGLNANEFVVQLRTNVLAQIAGAIGNVSAITHTNFILNLSSSETTATAVSVDYGDFKLIQAGLYAAEYLIYTLNAQNLDVQLPAVYELVTNRTFSVERLLRDHPELLTIATTNDLQSARTALTNAVDAYMAASAFIRARSTNDVRLFNYDPGRADDEASFRTTLQALNNSLALGPQYLPSKPDLTADLSPQFGGHLVLRDLLPKVAGNAIELGSFPDLTFGGSIFGLRQSSVEGFFGQKVAMLPVGHAPEVLAANTLGVTFNTLRGHYYVLEGSTDLIDWQYITNFTAQDVTSTLFDSLTAGEKEQFYRLRDDTGLMAFSGVVLAQNTSQPIAGAEVYSEWDGSSTTTDANGRFYLKTTLSSTAYEDNLFISATGYTPSNSYYYGDGLVTGLQIYLAP